MSSKEVISSFVLNAHHTQHVIYGVDSNERLFALVTFKDCKNQDQVTELYGNQVSAEPQPMPIHLRDTTPFGIINSNINFMKSNFESISEII